MKRNLIVKLMACAFIGFVPLFSFAATATTTSDYFEVDTTVKLIPESANWSEGSITLWFTDGGVAGSEESYVVYFRDASAQSEDGWEEIPYSESERMWQRDATGKLTLTDPKFATRLDGIPPVEYLVVDSVSVSPNGEPVFASCITRTKHGIFVGVGHFENAQGRQLTEGNQNCNSAELLAQLARDKGKMKDIHKLIDREAIYDGIDDAFKKVAAATTNAPGDVCLVYFATHGGRLADSTTTTLALYSSRGIPALPVQSSSSTGTGTLSVNSYTDIHLAAHMATLDPKRKGVAVIGIISACHSGGFIDDYGQYCIPDNKEWCLTSSLEFENVAWITSADISEESFGDGRLDYNFFNYFLLHYGWDKGWAASGNTLTFKNLADYASRMNSSIFNTQTMEGCSNFRIKDEKGILNKIVAGINGSHDNSVAIPDRPIVEGEQAFRNKENGTLDYSRPSVIITGITGVDFWIVYYKFEPNAKFLWTLCVNNELPGTLYRRILERHTMSNGSYPAGVAHVKAVTGKGVSPDSTAVNFDAWHPHRITGTGSGGIGTSPLTFSQTYTFTSYLQLPDDGGAAGTMTVKTQKEKGGVAAATVTIQPAGGKKQTIKGTISTADGTGQGALAGLTFTASGVTGTLNGYSVDGAIDASKSKDAAMVAVLNAFKGKSYVMALEPEAATGENAAMVNGIAGFSIVFSAKGKAKVSGTMPAGKKVSVSSQLIVGSEWCCLPVVYSKTGNSLAFLLWFDREGNFDSVSGMTAWKGKGFEVKWNEDVAVSEVGNLSGTSYFHLADSPTEIRGAEVIPELLPVDVAITPAGAKWNIAKAKAVKLDRSGNLSYGANPSGLKLTYTAKTGMFKGSLSLYTMNRGRLKKNRVSISGIVVNGVGYGTATLKKVGCWPIVINAEAAKAADSRFVK